jgi:hypothetical protein
MTFIKINVKTFVCFVLIICGFESFGQDDISLESYRHGEGIRFSQDDSYSFRIRGWLQPWYQSTNYVGDNEISYANRFRMRRARINFEGNPGDQRFYYRLQFDLTGNGPERYLGAKKYLLDAFIRYNITNQIRVTFGQRMPKTDSREVWMRSNTLQFVERSRLTSVFSSLREFGALFRGNFRMRNGSYIRSYFSVSNGDGENVFSQDKGGLKVGGRIDFLPFGTFANFGQWRQVDIVRELIPKLVIGGHYSVFNGITSRRGRSESYSRQFIYINDLNNNGTLDKGEERLPDYTKYGIDFMFKYKGFFMLGEYVKSKVTVPEDINLRNNAYSDVPLDQQTYTSRFRQRIGRTTEFQDITPEQYVRSQMILGDAFNIQMGYLFKKGFSIDGRFTHLSSDEYSYMNSAVYNNRPNQYTIGIGQFLTKNYGAKIQASYSWVDGSLGISDYRGSQYTISGNEQILRLMVTFSF